MSSITLTPLPLLGAMMTSPWVSVGLGTLIAALLALSSAWTRRRTPPARMSTDAARAVRGHYAAEHRLLGIGALAVLVTALTVEVLARHVLDLNGQVSWWRYVAPMFTGIVVLAILSVVVAARTGRTPTQPVISATRRSWLSFGPRAGLIVAATALLALVITTIAAGMASSSIDGGPFVFLEIPAPNTDVDPARVWFFGWAYGVPVLVCTVLLAFVAIGALAVNASRPFLRPETVPAEHRQRRQTAADITAVMTGGALLTLAGAWRFLSDAGVVGPLTVDGDGTYQIVWRYADLAVAAGWLAPALEVAATVLLLRTASALLPPIDTHERETTDPSVHAERTR